MHTPPWRITDEPTGRVRVSIGKFGRAAIQLEVRRTAERSPGGERRDNGRFWRTATRHDTAMLVRLGALEPAERADKRETGQLKDGAP